VAVYDLLTNRAIVSVDNSTMIATFLWASFAMRTWSALSAVN
jgi:hypothetical protein